MSEQTEGVPRAQAELDPKQTDRDKRLTEIGFVQLGKADLYEKGAFTVRVKRDGSYVFYSDLDPLIQLRFDTITGIKVDKHENANYIALTGNGKDGPCEYKVEPSTGSSEFDPNKSDKLVTDKSIEQQLLSAGFLSDERAGNLFRQTFVREDSGNTSSREVVVVVEKGEIKKLIKETKDRYYDTALTDSMGYEIIGIEKNERFGEVLKARNDVMTFDITSDGSIRNRTLLRELTYEELGVVPFPEKQSGGFMVGGMNSTETIRQLTEINGIPIVELEQRMRPERTMQQTSFTDRASFTHKDMFRSPFKKPLSNGGGISREGFLGPQERLLDVLAQDNEYVLSLGLTHQDLARELNYASKLSQHGIREFTHNGKRYSVNIETDRGYQKSPFNDDTWADSDMIVTNLDTGKSLKTSLLVPQMIERYGFYEGHGTPYRVSPEAIVEVFDFLKETKTN